MFAVARPWNASHMFGLVAVVLLMTFGVVVVFAILAFPFVGLALIPVFVLGLLAVIGWNYEFVRRGPRGLPERTTSPREPNELGRR
jgi:hypothetical protein